jgi:YD repeat-containing protein
VRSGIRVRNTGNTGQRGIRVSRQISKNRTTTWAPHENDGIKVKTYADGDEDQSTYDERGLLTDFVHRSGEAKLHLDYDVAGRLTERTWEHTAALVGLATYEYDAANRLTRSTAAAAVSTWPGGLALEQDFSYNAEGQLAGPTRNGRSVSLGYDLAGRVAQITYPSGMIINYSYDFDGLLSQIKRDNSVIAAYTHDAAGRRSGRALANGATTSCTYDAAGQMLAVAVTGPGSALLT